MEFTINVLQMVVMVNYVLLENGQVHRERYVRVILHSNENTMKMTIFVCQYLFIVNICLLSIFVYYQYFFIVYIKPGLQISLLSTFL